LKLGKRLKKIEAMVPPEYGHIWDCCCDHGFLGATLLARQAAPCIHFVDIVPGIVNELKNKLQRFFPQQQSQRATAQWHVHCVDTSSLPIKHFSGKHLVTIAGVGGELMAHFIEAISTAHPDRHIDFLLCPVHHEYALRETLIRLGFTLTTETLVEENRRYYEILLVAPARHSAPQTSHQQQKIDPVGSLIWQPSNAEQLKIATNYLEKTLQHYRKIQRGSPSRVQHIIEAYSAITI